MRPRPVLKWHRPAAHVPVTMTQIPSGTKPGKPGVFYSAAWTNTRPYGRHESSIKENPAFAFFFPWESESTFLAPEIRRATRVFDSTAYKPNRFETGLDLDTF